jgi:hypothetical protein
MWSNIILRRLPAQLIIEAVPESWAVPISDAERSTLNYHTSEWMNFDSALRHARQGRLNLFAIFGKESTTRWLLWQLARPMVQPQHTSNRYAELIIAEVDTLDVPYERLPEAVARVQAMWNDAIVEANRNVFGPKRIYNIGGDLAFAIAAPLYHVAGWLADLEGFRRVALIAAELRSQRVAPGAVSRNLENAPARDPYTGKPFLWDEETSSILFLGIAPGDSGRRYILY